MNGPQLSKWWQTPSAQAAMARAKQHKRDRLDRLKQSVAERKAKLAREVAESQDA